LSDPTVIAKYRLAADIAQGELSLSTIQRPSPCKNVHCTRSAKYQKTNDEPQLGTELTIDALTKVVARVADGVRVSELCAFGDEIILSYVRFTPLQISLSGVPCTARK
jgi:hypothetical protein